MVVLHLISLLKFCAEQRGSLMFRVSHYCKELEAFTSVLNFLIQALPQVQNIMATRQCQMHNSGFGGSTKITAWQPIPSLGRRLREVLHDFERNRTTRLVVFLWPTARFSSRSHQEPTVSQFSPSVGRIFRFIGVILATYSLSWEKGHGPIGSLLNSGRFFLSPEQRAERIIKARA